MQLMLYKKSFRKHGLFLQMNQLRCGTQKSPPQPAQRGRAARKAGMEGWFWKGSITLEEAEGPDSWAQPWLLAAPCCPPARHNPPHRTPASGKVVWRPRCSGTKQVTGPHKTANILPSRLQ